MLKLLLKYSLVLTWMVGICCPKDLFAQKMKTNLETTTLAAGCFWCVEAIFEQLDGVVKVESGYSGGHVENPSYKEVCTGETGHAEVCQISYNADVISFTEILEVFFSTHNPTTYNRQGNDVGSHYRSAIFYHNDNQRDIAIRIIEDLDSQAVFSDKIVTAISKYDAFYKADESHQDYFNQNTEQPYCDMVIKPKVERFKKVFQEKLKK